MRYTAQSSKYALKNFIYLIPFAIIPAWFFSLSTDQEAIKCALESIFHGNINDFHFQHIFRAISILNFASWYSVVFGIAAVLMLIVCGALLMAFLDKHMRIGKRTLTGILSKLNDNIVSTAGLVLLVLAIYELWTLLTSALVFVAAIIPVVWLAYALAIVLYLAMHFVLIFVIGKIYLWLPCMQITGFKAFEALRYSQYLVSSTRWKLLVSQLGILFFVQVLVCLCALSPYTWLFTLLTTVFYLFIIIIFCVRMMVVYFDKDNIERADLRKYYQ